MSFISFSKLLNIIYPLNAPPKNNKDKEIKDKNINNINEKGDNFKSIEEKNGMGIEAMDIKITDETDKRMYNKKHQKYKKKKWNLIYF